LNDQPSNNSRPLCVDLDGTLIATDTMCESILAMVKHKPAMIALLPLWIMTGLSGFKRRVAAHAIIDPSILPYRAAVLQYVREQKLTGRPIILATASDRYMAQAVADHLQIFDHVIATNGHANLKGAAKAHAIAQTVGQTGFDYIGDSWADLPVWAKANTAHIVNPSPRLLARTKTQSGPRMGRIFDGVANPGPVAGMLVAMRLPQWIKNLLLAVPMCVGQQLADPHKWLHLLLAFLTFSLCTSAVYLANDMLDLHADRQHPTKRNRPFASGQLSLALGMATSPLLLILAFTLALWTLPLQYFGTLFSYVLLAAIYSLWAKGRPVIDVLLLAGLYTLRIIAGGVATDVYPSAWLLAFSMFIFLSLAFAKRYAELTLIADRHGEVAEGRGYIVSDRQLIGTVGPSSGYMAVLVFCLYISSDAVLKLYQWPQLLWLIAPLLLYWITRLWFKAQRGKLIDDPVFFAMTDWVTYALGVMIIAIAVAAAIFAPA
jgi:4-hydroxybenzoate polyprenyltransferase/phosphoserine phosphatase